MNILVTAAASPLGRAVSDALVQDGHVVRAADSAPPSGQALADFHRGELTDPAFVEPLLRGIDAVVHLAPLALAESMPVDAPGEILDAATRGTHVLLKAAVEGKAGTDTPPVVVQGSTLAVMDAYPDDLEVTEQWRPRPRPEAAHLAPYLSELVAREFTRDVQLDHPLRAVCLRFAAFGTGADDLSYEDAAHTVLRALDVLQRGTRQRGHRWQLYHIASPSPQARYTSAAAIRALNFRPAGPEPGTRN